MQIGEQRSRGFDMDLVWQPVPGLQMIGSYAHIDAFLVQDQFYPAGDKVERVPANNSFCGSAKRPASPERETVRNESPGHRERTALGAFQRYLLGEHDVSDR